MSDKFVIVGLGSIGQRHLKNIRSLKPDANIALLRRSESLPNHAEKLADRIFYNLSDALDFRPQLAVIAGPASHHAKVAATFMANEIPVFIEKPLVSEASQLKEFDDILGSAHAPALVGYNMRFNDAFKTLKALLDQKIIGNVLSAQAEVGQYLPNWRTESDYRHEVSASAALGGGALLELSHELDYLTHLFGMPEAIYCQGGKRSKLQIDVEDMVQMLMRYDDNPFSISVSLDFLQPHPSRFCKIIGDEGTLIWNVIENSLMLDLMDGSRSREAIPVKDEDRNQMYLDEMEHCLACVEGRATPICTLEQGSNVVKLVEAAKQSMMSMEIVRLTL